MQLEDAAKILKELGHPTRLAIYKRIVRAGHQGIAVGELQQQLDIPGSTLSPPHIQLSLCRSTSAASRRQNPLLCRPVPKLGLSTAVLAR